MASTLKNLKAQRAARIELLKAENALRLARIRVNYHRALLKELRMQEFRGDYCVESLDEEIRAMTWEKARYERKQSEIVEQEMMRVQDQYPDIEITSIV